jgi:hypothetical protein
MTDFCGLADQIACAGSLGCCTDSAQNYSSQSACINDARCSKLLGSVFVSSELQSGALTYDAGKAGDFLREQAAYTKSCGAIKKPTAGYPFLIGTRDSGADCTPQETSNANTYTCKPGLSCVQQTSMTGTTTGVCKLGTSNPVVGGQYGDACATAEDCQDGSCQNGTCGTNVNETFCLAPEVETPPSNTSKYPTKARLKPHSDGGSGTYGDVSILVYYGTDYSKDKYQCSITSALQPGQEASCTLTKTGTGSLIYDDSLTVTMTDPDGLRIDKLCLNWSDGTSTCKDAFQSRDDTCTCAGYNYFTEQYGSCWLDADGNGNKTTATWFINTTPSTLYCT